MSAWWDNIDTSKGLTPEQLKTLVYKLGERIDPISGDDYYGGVSSGCDLALEIIGELTGGIDQ